MNLLLTAALFAGGSLTCVLIRKYLRAWEWLVCAVCLIFTLANAAFDLVVADTKGAVFEIAVALVFAWALCESWPRRYRRRRDA
jgi:hypothetical protein